MVRLDKLLYDGKEGLIIGAVIGFLVGKFLIPLGDVQALFATQSLLESAVGTLSVASESSLFFTVIGGVIGFFVDSSGFAKKFIRRFK